MEKIANINARQIFDSRANPTVEADVVLSSGKSGRAAVPSGASTGKFEALELRDGGDAYAGKGVMRAVENIEHLIKPTLIGMDARELTAIDQAMLNTDGTDNKARLGANATLAVSLAAAKALAAASDMPLYSLLGGCSANILPVPMMNILNGGAHASNNVDIQEFMVMPVGAPSFSAAMRTSTEVYHALKHILTQRGLSTTVGDEGGFAPDLAGDEEALELIMQAIGEAGYTPGQDFVLAVDAAASEWATPHGEYIQPKSGRHFSTVEMVEYWAELSRRYPIASIEDGLGEEDWAGWAALTAELGRDVQLVGDDLFVTNTKRIQTGIDMKCANAVLIKPNQIGTLSETLAAVKLAHSAGYRAVISHRSGETEDTTIADLAVATAAKQIKTGAPARSDRVAKYNRLLRIEEELAFAARWPGKGCFSMNEV